MIYEDKLTADIEKRQTLKEDLKPWQLSNSNSPLCVKVQPLIPPEPSSGGIGGGGHNGDDESDEGNSDNPDDSNALLRTQLAEPLTRLCNEYKNLSGILELCNKDAGAGRAIITDRVRTAQNQLEHIVRTTIKEIATIADVCVDLSCKSIHNYGNCKNRDKIDDKHALRINSQSEQMQKDSTCTEQQKTLTLEEFSELESCTREDITTFLTTLIDLPTALISTK